MGDRLLQFGLDLVERGLVPDAMTRAGIRRLCRARLSEEQKRSGAADRARFVEAMTQSPVAPVPEKANEQHYELPAEFFSLVLGRHAKYSCCCFEQPDETLDAAEANALRHTCGRAGLEDGQSVLELGCGWGSLTLWMAEYYPNSRITAVSNSAPQRAHIEARACERGLENLHVITADMNEFETGDRFDRVISVEMFEHMRNYERLMERVAGWLKPDGRLFVHIFCHRRFAYAFETEGAGNWLGRHFFTGGLMPSEDLLHAFPRDLQVVDQWWWNGTHYERTSNAWLANMDRRRAEIMPILEATYGRDDAARWFQRWRVFFLACAELFGFDEGREWGVGHYLLAPVAQPVEVVTEPALVGTRS